jgi:hypothetical protein
MNTVLYHIYTRPKLLVSNETNWCHGELNIEDFLTISISGKVKQAMGQSWLSTDVYCYSTRSNLFRCLNIYASKLCLLKESLRFEQWRMSHDILFMELRWTLKYIICYGEESPYLWKIYNLGGVIFSFFHSKSCWFYRPFTLNFF